MKTEPSEWSIDDQEREITTYWDGVYSHQAKNNMKNMTMGDMCLFYHSINMWKRCPIFTI